MSKKKTTKKPSKKESTKKESTKKESKKSSEKKSHDFPIFMHITSYPGAGKTTIGLWFTSQGYVVQDLDDFLPTKSMSHVNAKKYVEQKTSTFIKKHTGSKQLILVGTGCLEPEATAIPQIDAEHKIWLDVSLEESCIRAVKRQIEWLSKNQTAFLAHAKKSSLQDFAIYLENYYSPKKRAEDWKDLFQIYKKLGYIPMKDTAIKDRWN
jgi:shikimate kinase